jgi:hypothetical protein
LRRDRGVSYKRRMLIPRVVLAALWLGLCGCSGSDPGPGLACVIGAPGEACGCFNSEEANDVECNPTVVPGAVCCAIEDDFGTCTCGKIMCDAFADTEGCICSRDVAGDDTGCPPPAGGSCCLTEDKADCFCTSTATCAAGTTQVSECSPAAVEPVCRYGTMVSACR